MKRHFGLLLLLYGCASTWIAPDSFIQHDIHAQDFTIRTYQKITSTALPIHIYIEGDGYAFNSRGIPTHNPTPRGTFMRELAAQDLHPNVAYIARPCQYNMSENCTQSDWTDGRFSQKIVDNMIHTIKTVSQNRPVILIGYSGGALLSGFCPWSISWTIDMVQYRLGLRYSGFGAVSACCPCQSILSAVCHQNNASSRCGSKHRQL